MRQPLASFCPACHRSFHIVQRAGNRHIGLADGRRDRGEMRIFLEQAISDVAAECRKHREPLVFRDILDDVVDGRHIHAILNLVRLDHLVVFRLDFHIDIEFLSLFALLLINAVETIEHHILDTGFCHFHHS